MLRLGYINKKREEVTVNRMKLERVKRGLKQTDIAKILDCTPQYIAVLESGKRKLTVKKAQILGEFFGVNWYELING